MLITSVNITATVTPINAAAGAAAAGVAMVTFTLFTHEASYRPEMSTMTNKSHTRSLLLQ